MNKNKLKAKYFICFVTLKDFFFSCYSLCVPQVEVKTTQTDRQMLGELQAFAKTTPLNKDTKSEERQGLKPAGVVIYIHLK